MFRGHRPALCLQLFSLATLISLFQQNLAIARQVAYWFAMETPPSRARPVPDLRVVLTRQSTGLVNTYGTLIVTPLHRTLKEKLKLPRNRWITLELPYGHYPLQIGGPNGSRRPAAPRPFRSIGPFPGAGLRGAIKTSPQALARAFQQPLPPQPAWSHADDYRLAISSAFWTGIPGTINIHAGRGSWDSLFCPILGSVLQDVALPPPGHRHPYPGIGAEPVGAHYRVPGFSVPDSLSAQVEFNLIFSAARRLLGRTPTTAFTLGRPTGPPFENDLPSATSQTLPPVPAHPQKRRRLLRPVARRRKSLKHSTSPPGQSAATH